MANPLPITEFEQQIRGLVDQLFTANLHFQIGTGLRKSWREYYQELVQAHVFWEYTIHAHDTMAVSGLCRVYDNTRAADRRCLTLRRIIATVKANPSVFEQAEFRKRLEQTRMSIICRNGSLNSMPIRSRRILSFVITTRR